MRRSRKKGQWVRVTSTLARSTGTIEDFLLLAAGLGQDIWPEVPATKLWPQIQCGSPAARSSSNLRVVRAK